MTVKGSDAMTVELAQHSHAGGLPDNHRSGPVISIPTDWLRAASFLADLRGGPPLTDPDWDVLVTWLNSTIFDDRSYLAAEVAAGLIRDLAPVDVKSRLLASAPQDELHRRIQAVIRSSINRIHELGGFVCTTLEERTQHVEGRVGLAEQLEQHIERKSRKRIRGLRVNYCDGTFVLTGRTSTYYYRQLATHAALAWAYELADGAKVVNQIEVK